MIYVIKYSVVQILDVFLVINLAWFV